MDNPKAALIEAAGKLFSQKGYYGTTIRDIAQERGIRSGSLYAHIESKEDLLYEIVDVASQAFIDALEPIVATSRPPQEKLIQALAAHIRVISTHLETSRVFLHEWLLLTGARRHIIEDRRNHYEALWTALLQEGIDRGTFAPVSLRFARLVILSVANWVYLWYDPAGPMNPDQIAEEFGRLILYGLVHPTAGPPASNRETRTLSLPS